MEIARACLLIAISRITQGHVFPAYLAKQETPHDDSSWFTPWNNHLEQLRQERFFLVGESQRGGKFYGTQKEAEAAWAIRMRRYKAKRERAQMAG